MYDQDKGIESLNSLLRGELAATETYQQALAKVDDRPLAGEIERIHREHREAANSLRLQVHNIGGQPSQGSGAWGAFAKSIEGVAKVFGNTAAIKALKEGEEHGVKEYEKALADDNVPSPSKILIRSKLLPQTRAHIPVLDRFMANQA